MAYAIARMAKQKGGNVASAGHHSDRTREVPNADHTKRDENQLLIGDQTPVHELVRQMIDDHGGKPRSDSVECLELMLTASPEYFTEGRDEINQERTQAFKEKAVEFLRERFGARCVKAVLHVDEKTPHVHAFVVPIDDRGKLNCKRLFGTRKQMREFQTAYAEKMKPLGLERGIEGSRARHQKIQRFYGAIEKEVKLEVDRQRIPDPPRVMMTEASRQEYKAQVITAVLKELHEPINTLSQQAMLTREEKGKREAAEWYTLLAQGEAKTLAAQLAQERIEVAQLRLSKADVIKQLSAARTEKSNLGKQVERLTGQVQALADRLQDIPLVEVMRAAGYPGEQRDGATIYRSATGQVALCIEGNQAQRGGQIVARNSIDMLLHLRTVHERKEMTPPEAVGWLADKFGSERAVAAMVCHTEQGVTAFIFERQHERERARQHETPAERERTREPEHDHDFFSR